MDTPEAAPVVSVEIVRALVAARRMLDQVEHEAGTRIWRAGDRKAGSYGRLSESARAAEAALFQVLINAAVWCEEAPSISATNRDPI